MKTITVKELTLENFRPYGSFSDIAKPSGLGGGIPGMKFYPDREFVELGSCHAAAISITEVTDQLKNMVVELEQHAHCGEGMMSIDGDMLVYFAPAGLNYPQVVDFVEAFVVPRNTFVTIRPGVWHCMPFVMEGGSIHVVNVLPERTYANDTKMCVLKEEERILISTGGC